MVTSWFHMSAGLGPVGRRAAAVVASATLLGSLILGSLIAVPIARAAVPYSIGDVSRESAKVT